MIRKSISAAGFVASALLACGPVLAQSADVPASPELVPARVVLLSSVTTGSTYYHRAGATIEDHDRDMQACLVSASTTYPPSVHVDVGYVPIYFTPGEVLGMAIGQMIVNGQATAALAPALRAANAENCMVARGWSVARLSREEGVTFATMDTPTLRARLAERIGLAEPRDEIVRQFQNEMSSSASFGIQRPLGDLSQSVSASLYDPPRPAARRELSRDVARALTDGQVGVRDDRGLVVVRIYGDQQLDGRRVIFTRVEQGETRLVPVEDDRPNEFEVTLRLPGGAETGYDVDAFHLPPGLWRIDGLRQDDMRLSLCQAAPAFEVRAGEAIYAGSFDLTQGMQPDLTPRDDLLPERARDVMLTPAAYRDTGVASCGGAYIYGMVLGPYTGEMVVPPPTPALAMDADKHD